MYEYDVTRGLESNIKSSVRFDIRLSQIQVVFPPTRLDIINNIECIQLSKAK